MSIKNNEISSQTENNNKVNIYVIENCSSMFSVWSVLSKKEFIDIVEGNQPQRRDHVIWAKMTGNEILEMFNLEDLTEARELYPESDSLWDEIERNGLEVEYFQTFEHQDFTPEPISQFETYVEYLKRNSSIVIVGDEEALDALSGTYLTVEQKNALKRIMKE